MLAIQYAVVLLHCWRKQQKHLILPVSLNAVTFMISTVILGGVSTVFNTSKEDPPHPAVYASWYIVLAFEAVVTLGISIFWKQMGFRHTHLNERLALLTLIVIGEGAIGTTITITRLLNKDTLSGNIPFLIFCMVLILVGSDPRTL